MRHRGYAEVLALIQSLPGDVQKLADKSFELLKQDPHHPSIHCKKIGRFRSARIGRQYRALAVESGDDPVWFWIGHHSQYDQLIGGR